MKRVFFIGLMVLLIAMVGSASAETITLTEDNSNVNRDNPGTLPDGIIDVQVAYDPAAGMIIYQDMSPTNSNGGTTPYITDPKIDEVAYNLAIDGSVIGYDANGQLSGAWAKDNNPGMDGFGAFLRDYTTSGPNNERPTLVKVTLVSKNAAFPSTGNSVAVHLAFSGAYNADGSKIMESSTVSLGSTFLAGRVNVPEFPSVVLPITAILGLIFITQRKRKEE